MSHRAEKKFVDIVVEENDFEVGEWVLNGRTGVLSFELFNVAGGDPNTDFKLQIKFHSEGTWETFLAGADWASTTNSNKPYTSTVVPDTLAAGATAYAVVNIPACFSIRFLASSLGARLTLLAGFAEERG